MFRLLPALLALSLLGADWPRFRGPNGTGTSADRDVPTEWTAKNVLWQAELPGGGHSSPIIIKGKIYIQAATDSERFLVCIDTKSGKEIWKNKIPATKGKIQNPKGSHASATPCSDGERIYCVFWDGSKVHLHVYTLDGKPSWDQDLGEFKSQHGPGFSPIVHEGLVIVNNDQDGTSKLQAFYAKTGKPAWSVNRKPFRACYSTPFILESKDGPELVVASTAGITRYNPADGKELWNYNWTFTATKPLRTVGSPVVSDGVIILGSGDGDGSRALITVKLAGKGDVTKNGLAWKKDVETPYVPSILAHEGHFYIINDVGTAICFEAKTGDEKWKQARIASNVSASPLLINGKIFVIDEKGDVVIYTARPDKFELVAKNKLGEKVLATPAIADGRLYVRGEKHLICVGKP